MDDRREIQAGQVEWLDLGPAEPVERIGQQGPRRRPWYLLAGVVAVAVILIAALNHGKKHPAASNSPSQSTSAIVTDSGSSTSPAAPSSSASVAVTSLGHRMLDVPADWVLFARGPDSLLRIELARGRVTRTAVPELDNGSGVSFVIGPDRVLALTVDAQGGYEVPDGRPTRDLRPPFGAGGPVLPGPDPAHVWVPTGGAENSAMTLVGFDGRRTGRTIRVPNGIGTAESDRAGYLRFYATGGVYEARPEGVKRITTGALLASGPTRWLTEECDAEFRCATNTIDRRSGARHTVAASNGNYTFSGYSDGVISADGAFAAIARDDRQEGRLKLELLDLATGAVRDTGVFLNPDTAFNGGGVIAWSPDSRWLFIAAQGGRLLVLDRTTMRATELPGSLPFVSQVGLRTG
ncbi:MAG: hypothetical protein M3Y44_15490 [Actinomycetota bacterium]|nr:hypothetical protein [Actinomycetota bacterium]